MTTKETEQQKYEFPDRYQEGQATYPLCVEVRVRKKDLHKVKSGDPDLAHVDIDYHVVPRKGDRFSLICATPKVSEVIHFGGLDSLDDGFTTVRLKITLEQMRVLREEASKGNVRGNWRFDRYRVPWENLDPA